MLDLFINKQPMFCEEIINSIKNNKISHAYLIENNNYLETDEIIISFIKEIFRAYIEDDLEFENVCNLIDNDSFEDFEIITPDGAWIKKEQILDIKEKFKTTSVNNRPRVYLIKEADKLNAYASNSLLKFLEEPEGNIIAILSVDNRYKVLETIRSRCQIYTLINHEKKANIDNIELIEKIVRTIEEKGKTSIALLPSVLENDYRDKKFWIDTLNAMIYIYENSIRKKENLDYVNCCDVIDYICNRNSIGELVNKINILFTTINELEYNLNITMMLDRFIIQMSGGDKYEKNGSWH